MTMKEWRLRPAILVLPMLVAFLCLGAQGFAEDTEVPMPDPNVDYAWQLSDEEARELIQKIKSLRYGDELDEVRNLLGKPSLDTDVFDKKGKFIAHVLEYPMRRVRPEGGNINDQEITLYFDELDKLNELSYSAMPPLLGDVIDSGVVPHTDVEYFFTRPPNR